jgi:hypothetical protein
VGAYQLYGVFSNEGYAPQQPIPFSHVLHSGVMKMECLYCHHTAEKGAHAGVPSTDVCMGCHSIVRTDSPHIQKLKAYYDAGEPVPWVRIHRLPDHAYFSHQWHVAAGIACQTCHGPVQEMPVVRQWQKLEMKACMDCHRQDTYVDQIYHPPTYHEQPVTAAEVASAIPALEAVDLKAPKFQSVAREFGKHYEGNYNAHEAQVMMARLAEYRTNHYLHGRGAQARGVNASVECSICHY